MATEKTKPAVKLLLGSQAISFPLPVTIKRLDGTEVYLTFTAKAQLKTEWAKVKDAHQAALLQAKTARVPTAGATAPTPDAPTPADTDPPTPADQSAAPAAEQPFDIAAFFAKHGTESLVLLGLDNDAELTLKAVTGWDLEDDFTDVNLKRLEDEFGGALSQVIQAYDLAIFQGRLGNLPK